MVLLKEKSFPWWRSHRLKSLRDPCFRGKRTNKIKEEHSVNATRNTRNKTVTKFKTKNKQQRVTTQRTIQKKKPPVIKFALMILLSGGALGGAIYWGVKHNKQVANQRSQKEIERQKLAELQAKEDDLAASKWNEVLKIYTPALEDVTLVEEAIGSLKDFIEENPTSSRLSLVNSYIAKLESVKEKAEGKILYQQKKKANQAIDIVNNLVKEAQRYIDGKEYLKAHNLFANYNGPLIEETKIEREKHMAQFNALADKERQKIEADKMAKIQEQRELIVAEVVQEKSINPFMNINELKLKQLYPGIMPIISDYKKSGEIIKDYYKRNIGKEVSITQKEKVYACKIIKTGTSEMLVQMLFNGRKVKTKIRYSSLSLNDKTSAIESVNP